MNFEEHLLVSDEDDCRNLLSDGSEDEETNSDNDEPFNQQISMQNEQAIPGQLPPPEEDLLFIRIQPTPNIQFVQSNKGNPMLFYQGFFHYLRNTSHAYWFYDEFYGSFFMVQVKLDQKYQTDVHFNEYIGMFRCLAFVPQRFLVSSFNQLVNFENDEIRQFGREADYPGLARFIAYFKTSWVCKESEHGNLSPRFPIDLWNHRDEALAGNPTTTCDLESWHRSINAVTRERGQSMWKCLKLFSTEIENQQLNDINAVRQFCISHNISLVVIGPEQQICEGWASQLEDVCSHVFAPSHQAAQLEASKTFAKRFMISNELPTAQYAAFNDLKTASDFVNGLDWTKIVIKEDGLCAGKGVSIAESKQEAIAILNTLFQNNQKADIVVEEFLEGFEVSALCFSDGHTIQRMPLSQDHKKALEGDRGGNTGGMGAVAPIVVTKEIDDQITHILQKTVSALKEQETPYKGVLYAGLMITSDGPRLLEFNCRFGDPETEVQLEQMWKTIIRFSPNSNSFSYKFEFERHFFQVLLRLLDTDLYKIFMACCTESLATIDINWHKKYCIGIVIASQGYPAKVFPTDFPITEIPENDDHTVTFYAGAKHGPDGQIVSCGGRVLCVTSLASSPFQAKSLCLKAVENIKFSSKHYRRDIGDFVLLPRSQLSYAKSGVNISEGNAFVDKIQKFCGRTLTRGTKQIGGFGALVDLQKEGFQNPQLVIGMDGVGTKIELAQQSGYLKWLGYDLVGMCVNDVLCHGAKPIAFLDYYVTGKLVKEEAVQLVESISEACLESGCALVGGETAEMPGVYGPNQWDLAGCCVGAREFTWPDLPLTSQVKEGDVLIGLPSNGLHSNGFSLVRKIMQSSGFSVSDPCPWDDSISLGHSLLQPTRIYVKDLLKLSISGHIKAMAHITGGGILENLPRALPTQMAALVDCSKWSSQPVFSWLHQMGNVDPQEMLRTFNCGLGMVLVVSPNHALHVQQQLQSCHTIGKVCGLKPGGSRVDFSNVDHLFSQFHFNASFVHRKRVNVAILISGSGSNMARLIHESRRRSSHCHVSVVISNKVGVLGLEVARELGVEAVVIPHGNSRPEFERKITKELEERGAELICLAGFMRVLTAEFVNRWRQRVINIHPSLLPSFKGAKAVPLALEAGVKITGCTVHFIEEDIDAGKILGQESVVIEPEDDEESLHKKIQAKEHYLFPKVMQEVAKMMTEKQK